MKSFTIKIPTFDTPSSKRLADTKEQLGAITKASRKRMATGLRRLAKRVGGSK